MINDTGVLFCPADRPDRFPKAQQASRSIILDLEDAVAPANRLFARVSLQDAFGTVDRPGQYDTTGAIVRVNPFGSDDCELDIEAIQPTAFRTILLPKVEDPVAVHRLSEFAVYALIETLAGLDAVDDIAASPNCLGLMWGGDDFTADLGGRSSRRPDGSLLPHAEHLRVRVLLSAKRHGKIAIDGPLLQSDDSPLLEQESTDAARMGYSAKAAISPRQLPYIRQGFNPSESEIERAKRIIELYESAGGGVAILDGLMIDGPVARQARAVLAAIPLS